MHTLLHDLHIDFLHVNLLIELQRKLGLLEQLCIYAHCHGGQRSCRERSAISEKVGCEICNCVLSWGWIN